MMFKQALVLFLLTNQNWANSQVTEEYEDGFIDEDSIELDNIGFFRIYRSVRETEDVETSGSNETENLNTNSSSEVNATEATLRRRAVESESKEENTTYIDDDLYSNSNVSYPIDCAIQIMGVLKEIRNNLVDEKKAKNASCHHHKRSDNTIISNTSCLCALFTTPSLKDDSFLMLKNLTDVPCCSHQSEQDACIVSCVSFMLNDTDLIADAVCQDVDHLNETQAYLHTKSNKDTKWTYSGFTLQNTICCHEKKKVDCS